MYRIEDWRFSEKLLQSRSGLKIEDSQKDFNLDPGLKKFFWESSIFKFFWESSIFNLQSRPGLKKFFWESSISNLQSDTFCNLMQLIANSRYFKGNQKWQEKRCQKNIGEKTKSTLNTSRNVKTVFFLGGVTRQIDRYMYTCMYVCMYVGIKMNRIFYADTNCNNYLHIHIHIYVYKMAPGSNQQTWFAILNSNFEMHSVQVRNVEVYKAQLKISLVAIQDFTQLKIIRNFT